MRMCVERPVRAGFFTTGLAVALSLMGTTVGLAQDSRSTLPPPATDPAPITDPASLPPGTAPSGRPLGGPSLGFWIDNDLFGGGTDRHYTNGFQLYYFSGERPQFVNLDPLAALLPWIDQDGVRRYGFAIGQNIYTPSDITTEAPDPRDQPYGGWLYARISRISEVPRHVDRIDLDLGMVGPASGAEQVQRFAHRIFPGARTPRGWDHQLGNEPGVVLSYEHVWRDDKPNRLGPLEWDLSPHVSASVGNVFTYATAGGTLRLGGNMAPPVGALVMRPTTGIPYQDAASGDDPSSFSWYVYSSLEGRAVARNIFLDGNSWKSSPSVKRHPYLLAAQAGVTMRYGRFGVTYAQNFLTPEFRGKKSMTNYGSIRLSYRW